MIINQELIVHFCASVSQLLIAQMILPLCIFFLSSKFVTFLSLLIFSTFSCLHDVNLRIVNIQVVEKYENTTDMKNHINGFAYRIDNHAAIEGSLLAAHM